MHFLVFKRGIWPPVMDRQVRVMAKDGTARGGARVGAGRKGKALTDKLIEGREAKVIMPPET